MFLRDHPLLGHRTTPSWPPTRTWTGGAENQNPTGEIGILRDVVPSNIEPADRCFLTIEHEKHPISAACSRMTLPFAVK